MSANATTHELPVPDEATFIAEVRRFLDASTELRPETEAFVWGRGSDAVVLFKEDDPLTERRKLEEAKAWRARRFDAGLGYFTGPARYGGRELPRRYQLLYDEIEAEYVTPPDDFFDIGLNMVAPTILAHGTQVTREAYLRRMYRGELVGAQLFSEPGAGSDLASLDLRAERDGDEWVLNGQKVWTSGAHYADVGEVLCRSNPDAPKHRGMTAFVVPMDSPGIEVRPLRQMTGGASFNEVFFTDVRVPDDHRLGDVDGGWTVAITTLMNERAAIGADAGGASQIASIGRLVAMLEHFGCAEDPTYRQQLADVHSRMVIAELTNRRAIERIRGGELPGPEMSIAKLQATDNLQAVSALVSRVLGPRIVADTGEWGTWAWLNVVLGTPGMRLAGGTDEVMKNIVAERVLGLPKEPGVDTTSPFRELRRASG